MTISADVRAFLRENAASYAIVQHHLAFTAQEEAAAAHVPGAGWAKAVVFFTAAAEPILAVLPATYQVNAARLAALAGTPAVRLASEQELARLYPHCERGAMAPIGALYGQRTFADEHLATAGEIVFNAGDHVEAVRMRWQEYLRLVDPVMGTFGERTNGQPTARTPRSPHLHENGGGWH
jgi:Ala-tRNA(Pro) deacylase